MPHGGIVDLIGIRVIYIEGHLRVMLVFADTAGRQHSRTYNPKVLLQAMSKFATADRMAGLKLLDAYPEAREGGVIWRLRFTDRLIGNLGSLEDGAVNHLLLLLGPRSPYVPALRRAIESNQERSLHNPYRA